MVYYAHSNDLDTSSWQLLHEHLVNTARKAAEMGEDSNLTEYAYLAGLLHDIGKYSVKFQNKLAGKAIRVDHSTAGAQEVTRLLSNTPFLAAMLAYVICGHHGGLPDFGSLLDVDSAGTLQGRLKRKLEDYGAYQGEINPEKLLIPAKLPIQPVLDAPFYSVSFLIRMLYSTLVDADFIDTETFMNQGNKPRGGYDGIDELKKKLDWYLKRFDSPTGRINRQRTETLYQINDQASENPGFFTLTIPTGGGKTNVSLAFALHHASLKGLKRIIYIIPYTSIIEQNAAEFKKILGEQNILEHHSNFDWDPKKRNQEEQAEDADANVIEKLKLAAENWDIPVVVTTNVQFFESLYSNRPSRCRKLHNLAKSVLIFDEAQMLPRDYLKPCMYAVNELIMNYGASAIFCTATQPALEGFFPKGTQFRELARDPIQLYSFYKRVQVTPIGKLSDEDIIQRLMENRQVLCIVNTRKHAKGLFQGLSGEGNYHLSTLMCPAHRLQTINQIRERLKQGEICRVVSTQIMEAGIDLDFPVGFRALAGLDSVIQAAGRVNREGRSSFGTLYVFEPDTPTIKRTPLAIEQSAIITRSILEKFSKDPICMDAIRAYFQELYGLQDPGAFDVKKIMTHFEKGIRSVPDFDFKTAAEKFTLIEAITLPVIIPFDQKGKDIIRQMKAAPEAHVANRKLQRYSVNIYENEYQALQEGALIDTYSGVYSVLNDMESYDPQTGLMIPETVKGEAIFFDG